MKRTITWNKNNNKEKGSLVIEGNITLPPSQPGLSKRFPIQENMENFWHFSNLFAVSPKIAFNGRNFKQLGEIYIYEFK